MDLTFSEMSVDTSLAEEYLKMNDVELKLLKDSKRWTAQKYNSGSTDFQERILNMASSLKENATLITQLEYHIRKIPIEDTNAQLSLLIQYLRYLSQFSELSTKNVWHDTFKANGSLLALGSRIDWLCTSIMFIDSNSMETVAIDHLLVTLLCKAGYKTVVLQFKERLDEVWPEDLPVKGLDSGTIAVVSEDADVDSAVDKFISISKQVPWRLRRILVQESVYQQFKEALSWKCNLNKSGSKPLTSDVLCSDTLTYNDRRFLIDPVELSEDESSVVTVEAYRTTKEMIGLVQQDEPHYLSLWTNVIAEINEVLGSTKAPVVWVNNIADFRGPLQVSGAIFTGSQKIYLYPYLKIKKCAEVAKLCEVSQSWLKFDLETRREIICGVLDKFKLKDPKNKLYTELKKSLSSYIILNSFVDIGKDYVCIGTLEPVGIIKKFKENIFSEDFFKLIIQGNAFITDNREEQADIKILQEAGVPVVYASLEPGDFKVFESYSIPTRTRVSWTNSGTIFAN